MCPISKPFTGGCCTGLAVPAAGLEKVKVSLGLFEPLLEHLDRGILVVEALSAWRIEVLLQELSVRVLELLDSVLPCELGCCGDSLIVQHELLL
jgi:hypothetical protein